MVSTLSYAMRIVSGCSLVVAGLVFVAFEARGQDMHMPLTSAPPPMKFVSRSERAQLSLARDLKERTRSTIELAELRLARAEQLTASQRYDDANEELGVYQGLVEDVLDYLGDVKKNDNKLRDTYKRLELALRAHCARIEAIRRLTPAEYAIHVKTICECARNARTEALNAFYGDTVVPEASSKNEHQTGGGSGAEAKDANSNSAKKQ